jgi:hypothetical protein
MEIAFSQQKILVSTFFLTRVTEPDCGEMFLPLAAETMPAQRMAVRIASKRQ